MEKVTAKLKKKGFQAWLAGGCVRDHLLGRKAKDFDVATDALPDQVAALFENAVLVGKAFGVIIVPFEGFQVEVSTFRSDGDYSDGRHPKEVHFSSPEEDAKRRDFTINALFYDLEKSQVVDFVNGRKDLKKRLIRCVGNPERRFEEDRLRVLRAVRFASELDFQIDEETWKSLGVFAQKLKGVSAERIQHEWSRLLLSDNASYGLQLLEFSGLWAEIFPHWKDIAAKDRKWRQIKRFMKEVKGQTQDSLTFRLGALLFLNKESDWPDLTQLKDQELINAVHQQANLWSREAYGHLKYSKTELTETTQHLSLLKLEKEEERLRPGCQKQLWTDPSELPPPWLTGSDLKKLGVKPGPQMGELLKEAYLRQLENLDTTQEEQEVWLTEVISVDKSKDK